MQLFRALRDGRRAGAIAAIADRMHQEVWNEPVGFCGVFETIEDYAMAEARVPLPPPLQRRVQAPVPPDVLRRYPSDAWVVGMDSGWGDLLVIERLADAQGMLRRTRISAATAIACEVADRGGYAVPGAVLNGVACPALLTGCLADPRTPGIAAAYARLAARIPACSLHLEARTGSPYIEYPWMWSNPAGFRAQAAAFWDALEGDGQ